MGRIVKKELRKLTQEELDIIIESHDNWVDLVFSNSSFSKNVKGEKADLSYVDINGLNLMAKTLVEIDFIGSNLEDVNFSLSNLIGSNFSEANLSNVNFSACNLKDVNFSFANLANANFSFIAFEDVRLTNEQLESIAVLPKKIERKKNIEDEASFEIEELQKRLNEQRQQLLAAKESEKDKIKTATKLIEDKLEEKEKELEREKKSKESTKEDIEAGIGHLKAPNNYLKAQINIQYGLTILYGILGIISVWFLFHYVYDHYSEFKDNLTEKTTFLQWLFYALPIAVCFSLIITFINQINSRLKNVIVLHEKKRYVDSISGGLKAVQELSENNQQARTRISGVLDEILNNTITLSEKLQKDALPEEKPIDNKVSLSVKELKDLFSK